MMFFFRNNFKIFFLSLLILTYTFKSYGSIKEAKKSFNNGDYPKAAVLFYEQTSNKASRDVALAGLGETLFKMRLFYSAAKFYTDLLNLRSTSGIGRAALAKLGMIDSEIGLGQSHVSYILKSKVESGGIPGPAQGFFFYYKGVELFAQRNFKKAFEYFKNIDENSSYFIRAQFHLGVIATFLGQLEAGISYLEKIKNLSLGHEDRENLLEEINLNLARIYYESEKYQEAISYYAMIPRESDNWLEALFESAWAFFMIGNPNHTLGNIHTIHSPFFDYRFYPESHVLQAITFLRQCRYDEVKTSLENLAKVYTPTLQKLISIQKKYTSEPIGVFDLAFDYRSGNSKESSTTWVLLDRLSRLDTYKEAAYTIKNSAKEISILENAPSSWKKSGLFSHLNSYLSKKQKAAKIDTGKRFLFQIADDIKYLTELFEQTKLIQAELMLGKVDEIRSQLQVETKARKVNFIGGMQPLVIGQELEYWPFEGEYWEDELGGYVYNINSECKK